ncbi:phage tail protein, partial [Streptomyces sp. SID11233]|nr:phage tail protein [Streptomyces sp. SID11233]
MSLVQSLGKAATSLRSFSTQLGTADRAAGALRRSATSGGTGLRSLKSS